MTERQPADTQELAAMLQHRFAAIAYKYDVMLRGHTAYVFMTADGRQSIQMYEVDDLEALDLLIKRDPQFPFASVDVVPTVSTESLVREAQDYLGEQIFSEEALPALNFPRRPIDPTGTYWLAWKEVPPFSPLLPKELQDDVHRRTVHAQRGHFESLEFADDNPVGRPIGILVAEAQFDEVVRHVQSCDVYPDTLVTYTQLLPMQRAWKATERELMDLRRPMPNVARPF